MSKDKKLNESAALQATLVSLAQPGLSSKDLLKALKKAHPKATKREIIIAAFGSLIEVADSDGEKALRLQDLALSERQSGDPAL